MIREDPRPPFASPPAPSRAHRLLAWATALAILLGGVNAAVQIARVILG